MRSSTFLISLLRGTLSPPTLISLPQPQPCSAIPVALVGDRSRRCHPNYSLKWLSSPPSLPLKSGSSPPTSSLASSRLTARSTIVPSLALSCRLHLPGPHLSQLRY
ncbi:hypothetical protein PIB30_105260 [Stylosanthes scabra]|uniref:Secreted protein n=1 Tax=Stylosanthes scabra TaxID=79078 RepID=A0ABU6T0W0_9FABA|nr:hypothetical protein [Stylosanthes scabra]